MSRKKISNGKSSKTLGVRPSIEPELTESESEFQRKKRKKSRTYLNVVSKIKVKGVSF